MAEPAVEPSSRADLLSQVPAEPTEPDDCVEAPRRGRPRAEGRTADILRAALDLLEEVGYEPLRMQDIADRAGAGLATIYRRWPTKQALLADAVRFKAAAFDPPVCGDPVVDLGRIYHDFAEQACGRSRTEFLAGLIGALQSNPELAQAFRTEVVEGFRDRIRTQLEHLVGADFPQLELLVDVVPGVVLFRRIMRDVPVDPDEVAAEAVALVQQLGAKRDRSSG